MVFGEIPKIAVEGVVLTHGAGGDRNHSTLVSIAEGLAPLPVERINFPYRNHRRRPPDRAPKLLEFLHTEIPAIAARLGTSPDRLVLGGRSLGGRMCSIAVAEGLVAAGLLLLSYPLHPPTKPENLRTEHFPNINVPCLFISGDRDPFGRPEEFEQHLATITGPVSSIWLPRQGHEPKGVDHDIVNAVLAWVQSL